MGGGGQKIRKAADVIKRGGREEKEIIREKTKQDANISCNRSSLCNGQRSSVMYTLKEKQLLQYPT